MTQQAAKVEFVTAETNEIVATRIIVFGREAEGGFKYVVDIAEMPGDTVGELVKHLSKINVIDAETMAIAADGEWVAPDCLTLAEAMEASATYHQQGH